MIYYKFDGTKDGLLCCLFESFTNKETPEIVTSGEIQMTFDCQIKTIETDEAKALRVREGFKKFTPTQFLNRIFYLFRSFDPSKETIMFNVARKCLEARRDVSFNFADADVVIFNELLQKISYEIHRLHGFIRFEESLDNVWYSHFEPDNDVIDLVAPHFLKRLAMKFILHDVKRNKVAICDGKTIKCFTSNLPLVIYLSANELKMQELWKTYYDSVNIVERKNTKLMDNYLPRRYRKHMSETQIATTFKDC